MNNLVYRFSKCIPGKKYPDVNFLYKDKKVHVRLGFYGNKKQHIRGFEAKLAFFMTLSMQREVKSILDLPSIKEARDRNNYQEIWEKCLACLKQGAGYQYANDLFYCELPNYSGMKILPAYSLKNRPKDAFDLLGEVVGLDDESLKEELVFNDLKDLLFNDAVEISIEECKDVDNSKFVRKHTKDREKLSDAYQLW